MRYRDDTAPVTGKPLFDSLAMVADPEVPDPYVTFPMSEILKATWILKREIGDGGWICARADQGPMDLSAQLRGIKEFMMNLALGEEEDLVHALMDYSRRVATRYANGIEVGTSRAKRIPELLKMAATVTAVKPSDHHSCWADRPE